MTETWPQMQRRHIAERNAAIIAAHEETDGNQTQAARLLGMERANIQRIIREHGLDVLQPRFKRADELEAREEWHVVK